jgi:hypothetical protein
MGLYVGTPLSSSSLSSLTFHSSQTLARRHRLPPAPLLPASHTWSLLEPPHHSAPLHVLNLPRREDPTTPHRRRWGRRHRHLHGRRHPRRGHTPASTTTCASPQSSPGMNRSQTSTVGGGTSATRWSSMGTSDQIHHSELASSVLGGASSFLQ